MANTKSALKAMRVSERKEQRNKPVRTAVKTYLKRARQALGAEKPETAQEAVMQAAKVLDRAAQKGIIHPNNAARRKSRLMKQLNAAAGAKS